MIKYIGIILTSGAISMCGAFASCKIKSTSYQRKGLIELLYAIKSGIEYGGTALEEIYSHFENTALEKCGFIGILRQGQSNALENALNCTGLLLSDSDKALFFEFAKKCGKGFYAGNEKQLCSRYIALCELLDKKCSADENTKCMLYRRLGILCGLLFAVILL